MVQVGAHRFDQSTMSPSDQPLMAYLAQPNGTGRHPAVVLLHGCDGLEMANVVEADVLKSFGYVALALNSLGDFNACTSGDSGALAESFDAYLALDWLAQQDFVDPSRVALLGYSLGGIAVLDSVETGPIEESHKRRFRAAVAYYPNCRYRAGVMTVPTLILMGDKDDWTLVSWCREMMSARNGSGSAVNLVVYPGATHAFNLSRPPRNYLGHHLEYDPNATADAWKKVRAFLQEKLAGSNVDHPSP
jgi:dienelactone hydrolase